MIQSLALDIVLGVLLVILGIACAILARRLKRFASLEMGIGGAITVLSQQVQELNATLNAAQSSADRSSTELSQVTARAEGVAKELSLLVASVHDIELTEPQQQNTSMTELSWPINSNQSNSDYNATSADSETSVVFASHRV